MDIQELKINNEAVLNAEILTDDDILKEFYNMIDNRAIQDNKHKKLTELITSIKDETLIKLHINQDINYLKYNFNIWRYFDTYETRGRAHDIRMKIILNYPSNPDELSTRQLNILYFPEVENRKIEEIIIYDAKIGDIIKEYTRSGPCIYSKIYKITKSYLFLENIKSIDINVNRWDQLSYDTTYFINFLHPEYEGKRKIFMRKPDARQTHQTLHKIKDNTQYIINRWSYLCD
jgi:hypothetical protein